MILVGTIHNDFNGPERLEQILDRYSPKIITLEIPKNLSLDKAVSSINHKRNIAKKLVDLLYYPESYKKLELESIEKYGFELTVSIDYCRKTNSKLHFVDLPERSEVDFGIKAIPYQIGFSLFTRLIVGIFQILPQKGYTYEEWRKKHISSVNTNYQLEFKTIEHDKEVPPRLCNKRERFMADEILKINPDMHIGGYAHAFHRFLVGYPVTPLHKLLGNIVTKKVKLIDADKLSK